jgi:hypothetical protein
MRDPVQRLTGALVGTSFHDSRREIARLVKPFVDNIVKDATDQLSAQLHVTAVRSRFFEEESARLQAERRKEDGTRGDRAHG